MTRSQEDTTPILLSVREAADLLSVSPRLVQRLIAEGVLPSIRLGSRRLLRRDALQQRLELLEQRAPGIRGAQQ